MIQCIYLVYCRRHFDECRLRIGFNKEFWKEISAFSLWNFIGCTAGILRDQGINVLLNIFVGPVLNAARGIAGSVNSAVSGFASNFMTALGPQITKSYASGDMKYSHFLVERGARFSFYILLFFAIPILLETEFVLTVWLKQYPDHSLNFARLVLILSLIDSLSNTLIILQNATGKIRNYQLVVGSILLLNFPLSYLVLKIGLAPESTYIVAISVAICCMIARLMFVRKSAMFPMEEFLRKVVLNVIAVTICAIILPFALHKVLPYGWERFLVVGLTSVIATTIAVLFVGCNKNERNFILEKVLSIKKKFIR